MSKPANSKVPNIRFKGFEEEWEQKMLGDLGRVAMNKRVFKHETSETGDVPFYKIGTFGQEPDAFISRKLFSEYKRKYPYPTVGDLLISASGSIGRIVEYCGKDEYFQDSNIVWLQHDGAVVNSFLKQFYSVVRWAGLEGSTIKRLYNKNILETLIVLPDKDEQTQIGGYFRELDRLLGLHQRKHDKLVTLKKAMLQKMFPQPGATAPEIRFKGYSGDWEVKKLGEVATFLKGKGLPKSSLVPNGTEPCIHYGELFTRYPEIIGEIISRTNSSPDAFRSNANDVLMPTSDVTPRGLAKASCLTVDGVILGGDILVIRSDVKRICGSFLSYVIRREEGQVLQFVTGSTVFHLYGSNMKNFMFSMPSVSEQAAIATYFHTIDELISSHTLQLQKLKQVKAACLERMLV